MRRFLVVLALMITVSATPLRLLEAAHDLANTIAELGGESVIEITDGGVGDDSDATLLVRSASVAAALDWVSLPYHSPWISLVEDDGSTARSHPSGPRAPSVPRRLALLQRLLC